MVCGRVNARPSLSFSATESAANVAAIDLPPLQAKVAELSASTADEASAAAASIDRRNTSRVFMIPGLPSFAAAIAQLAEGVASAAVMILGLRARGFFRAD